MKDSDVMPIDVIPAIQNVSATEAVTRIEYGGDNKKCKI
jgi:hypothetical protein